MDELRSCWELPSIAYFCHVFREPLKLPDVDIEDLEESILLSATAEGSEILTSLICNLLKGCLGRRDIEQSNCDTHLRKLLSNRWPEKSASENPMSECDFRQLHPRKKVEILYELCQWRLLSDDVGDLVKDFDGGALRVEPVGTDEKGALYWYFVGTRLYKETPQNQGIKNLKKSRGSDRKKTGHKRKLHAKKKSKATKKVAAGKRLTKRLKGDDSKKEDEDPVTTVAETAAKWELLCSTVDEWRALADSFKDSKVRCEIDLHRRLTEEFLVIIPKIVEEKERVMRKKLLEMAPKRTSSRLQHKKHEHEEQLKIIEQLEIAERLEREQMEDARRHAAEEEKKLAAQRAREERQRIKEERTQRALLREMRATLIAEGKEVPPELFGIDSPTPTTPSAKGNDDITVSQPHESFTNDHNDEDLEVKLAKVLVKVRKHKNAWPFLEPVPESVAPDYYTIVLKPMDLSKIESKLKKKEYTRRQDFENDFNQMIANCELYNGAASDYTILAFGLRDAFNKIMDRCFAPKKSRVVPVTTWSDAVDGSFGVAGRVVNGHRAELSTAITVRAGEAASHISKGLALANVTAASVSTSSLPPAAAPTGGNEAVVHSDANPAFRLQESEKICNPSATAGSLLSAIASRATSWGIAGGRPLAPSTGPTGCRQSTTLLPSHSSPSLTAAVPVKQQSAGVAGQAWASQPRPRLVSSVSTMQTAAVSAAASLSSRPAAILHTVANASGGQPAATPRAVDAAQTAAHRLGGWGAVATSAVPATSLAAQVSAALPRSVALPVSTTNAVAAAAKPFVTHAVNSSKAVSPTAAAGSHAIVHCVGGIGLDHGVPGSKSASSAVSTAMTGIPRQVTTFSGPHVRAAGLTLDAGETLVQPVSSNSSRASGAGDVNVNGLRPLPAELGTSAIAVVATSGSRSAVGISSNLLALKHGWLPSHLNLPVSSSNSCGDGSRVGHGSGVAGGRPAADLSVNEASLKRPADPAVDSDTASKKPVLPSAPTASAAAT